MPPAAYAKTPRDAHQIDGERRVDQRAGGQDGHKLDPRHIPEVYRGAAWPLNTAVGLVVSFGNSAVERGPFSRRAQLSHPPHRPMTSTLHFVRRQAGFRRVTTVGALAVVLAALGACDSSPAVTEPAVEAAAPSGTFSATISDGTTLSGTVTASQESEADFTGAFLAYPVAKDRQGNRYEFTMIALRASSGEQLLLGQITQNGSIASGTYGIEPGRNLREPFDFVARYRSGPGSGRPLAAEDGSVDITVGAQRLQGAFSLRLEDGRTVTGTFSAATRR